MVCPGSRKSRRITRSLSQIQCTSLYPLRAASWTFSSMGNSHVAIPWTAILTSARSGDTTSSHRWWYGQGNCHIQIHTGSIRPDEIAFYFTALYYTVLYCTVLHCIVLYSTIVHWNVRDCTVLHVMYCILLYCTILYWTVLYWTVLYCTALYCTVLYSTSLNCTVL
jgi:hypothetical protein